MDVKAVRNVWLGCFLALVLFVFCVYYSYPEVVFSLMHSHGDLYDFSVCLLVGGDFEVVWAFVFSFRLRRPPDQAFEPLLVDEASVPRHSALIDLWVHADRL